MFNSDIWDSLLDGLGITLSVSAWAIAWGTVVAILMGVASLSSIRPLRWLVRVYVEVLRGVSAIILLFWVYFSLPLLGVDVPAFRAGVLALGLNMSAYGAEIVRGALQSVPRGQTEAAIAVNLSTGQRIWSILLPQAAVTMLPPYGSLLIEVMKASSLVSLIGLNDIADRVGVLRTNKGTLGVDTFDILTAALILYFAISLVLIGFTRLMERRFGRGMEIGRMAGVVK